MYRCLNADRTYIRACTLEYNFWGQPLTCKILEQNIRVEPEALCYKCKPLKFRTSEMLNQFLYNQPHRP